MRLAMLCGSQPKAQTLSCGRVLPELQWGADGASPSLDGARQLLMGKDDSSILIFVG